MKREKRLPGLFLMGITTVILVFSASTCGNDAGSSGSSGGNSGITYDASYTFKSVRLVYDFSSKHNYLNNLYQDANELALAHGVDGTKLSGAITNLQEILRYESNYPEERKPEIKITIRPQAEDPEEHKCTQGDIGENYVQNLPNYGANINKVDVSIKTIITTSHKLQLCWSKSFDLNQQWWESSDRYLNETADVCIGGYVKSYSSDHTALLRPIDEEDYEVVSIDEEVDFDDEVLDCEVEEIAIDEIYLSPTLCRSVYINGAYSQTVMWEKPLAVIINNEYTAK